MKNFLNNNVRKINDENLCHKRLITFLNPYSYLLARDNAVLFNSFDKIYLDGIALVKIFKLFGLSDVNRTSFDMTSLAPVVFLDAIKNKQSIYFIGSKPKVIDKAVQIIKDNFHELNIVGYRDGYFSNNEKRSKTIQAINEIAPDIVVCGMGTPVQEQFLVDLKDAGWNGVGYTCGGFLHQTAESIYYYPEWTDKYHLRWAYRIYDEPKLFKRYFIQYPKFLILFIFDFIKYKLL
ncbi:MAG: WecB/TagA/CpsF family glycosyltransferase [Campylobacterota bacterium]|nr:WecB/TagA/CpsF family glycosyltransferase [Campylobacterota bacterium]